MLLYATMEMAKTQPILDFRKILGIGDTSKVMCYKDLQ